MLQSVAGVEFTLVAAILAVLVFQPARIQRRRLFMLACGLVAAEILAAGISAVIALDSTASVTTYPVLTAVQPADTSFAVRISTFVRSILLASGFFAVVAALFPHNSAA